MEAKELVEATSRHCGETVHSVTKRLQANLAKCIRRHAKTFGAKAQKSKKTKASEPKKFFERKGYCPERKILCTTKLWPQAKSTRRS